MRIATFCFAVTIIITTLPFTTAQTYIPSEILDDYWAFYGYPLLEAGIIGANQFEKGDNVTLRVSLVNAGGRINFESTKVADTPMKKALSTAEASIGMECRQCNWHHWNSPIHFGFSRSEIWRSGNRFFGNDQKV